MEIPLFTDCKNFSHVLKYFRSLFEFFDVLACLLLVGRLLIVWRKCCARGIMKAQWSIWPSNVSILLWKVMPFLEYLELTWSRWTIYLLLTWQGADTCRDTIPLQSLTTQFFGVYGLSENMHDEGGGVVSMYVVVYFVQDYWDQIVYTIVYFSLVYRRDVNVRREDLAKRNVVCYYEQF